jgi:hypothetical protein
MPPASGATSAFTLRYRASHANHVGVLPAGSVTTVAVPAVQYPDGCGVRAHGASS